MLPVAQTFRTYAHSSVVSTPRAKRLIASYRKKGVRVGLCHGGFDLLHPGHVRHFESAKKRCDVLFVSVTGDRFVTERKGDGRPIFPGTLRAYMIANLTVVNWVVITDYKLGVDVIRLLKPDVYIKGRDFIGKKTPGITAEREAITAIGGTMAYTNDPKLSTTDIIDYIREHTPQKRLLIVSDRDGTLIDEDWPRKIVIRQSVTSFLSYAQTKYKTTTIVASNQTGVARGLYDEETVRRVNKTIASMLTAQGVTIDSWQYCPDADKAYAAARPEIPWRKEYVKQTTKRKPSPAMVTDALAILGKALGDFDQVVVIGNSDNDKGLADNLGALFIDVREKTTYEAIRAACSL